VGAVSLEKPDWRPPKRFRSPKELYDALEDVVGQEDLKRKLASAFSQYTLFLDSESAGKPTVVVSGPSGSGKTFAIEMLCDYCELPATIRSSASISPPGYKGLTLRDVFIEHWMEHRVDEGIIYLDEIDKWMLSKASDGEQRSHYERCQAEILRYLENDTLTFQDESVSNEELENVTMETGRLFWIMSGAFVGIDRAVRQRQGNIYVREDEIWSSLVPADYVRYGMLPEFANRIETWAWTRPLTQTQILSILEQQEVPKWQERFEAVGCDLEFGPGALSMVARSAFLHQTGGRGAKSLLRRPLDDLYLEVTRLEMSRLELTPVMLMTGHLDLAAGA
jgi:ATP-dependent Clp protease ATP-binding subunit ClpX